MVQLIWVTGVYKSPKLKKFGPRFCIQDLVSCRKTVPRIVPHCTSYCAALYLVLCRNCETNGKGPRIVPHWTSYHATCTSYRAALDLVLCRKYEWTFTFIFAARYEVPPQNEGTSYAATSLSCSPIAVDMAVAKCKTKCKTCFGGS